MEMEAVDQAKQDQLKKESRRKGLKTTLLAGETGGPMQTAQAEGTKKSLLG